MAELYIWALGAILTVNLAALTVIGALLRQTYDIATDLDVVIHGNTRDQKGFVQRTEEMHAEMCQQHSRVQSHLVIQGRLINELTYTLSNIAEQLDDHDDVDVTVDIDRIERLRDLEDEVRRDYDHPDD